MGESLEKEALERFEAQLREAEAETQHAIQRREALRSIVAGLRELTGESRPPKPRLLAATTRQAVLQSLQPEVHHEVHANGKVPRGREAVRRILIETPSKAWRVPEIAKEIGSRGWMPGTQRTQAVSATIQRLVKDGEVERVGHGLYQYRLDKIPPSTEGDG